MGSPTQVPSIQAGCKGSSERGQPGLPVPGARRHGQSTGICPLRASRVFAMKFVRSDMVEIIGMGWIECHEGKTASKV